MAALWEYDKNYTKEIFADIVAKFGIDEVLEMLADVAYERADNTQVKEDEKNWDYTGQKLDSLSLQVKDKGLGYGKLGGKAFGYSK